MLFSATEGSVWFKRIADGAQGFDKELQQRGSEGLRCLLDFSKLRTVWSQSIEQKFVEYLKKKVFVEQQKGNCN